MTSTYEAWDYGERVTSAGLNNLSKNGIPHFDTVTERDSAYLGANIGSFCYVAAVPTTGGGLTNQPMLFQARASSAPSGYTWVPYGLVAQFRATSTQTIATGTYTKANYDLADFDPLTTLSSNTFVAPGAGRYKFEGKVSFAANATNFRAVRWFKTGGSYVPGSDIRSPGGAGGTLSLVAQPITVWLAYGETIEMQAYQNSGGNLATVVGNGTDSIMTVTAV